MSSYVVLARKWRPKQFSDMVGQSPIVRTLNNAILSNRVHHAYLFTGSRGIGKTSIARIFAKVLRCENTQLVHELLRSCDNCSSCTEISAGNSIEVLEIDGASNNGVESVREIRENAKYLPATGHRKIYIIDEVHMLTTAAFNALLKTLEEPPSHVIFIFATTEPHKIPATILSRCQRFDYRKVNLHQIQTRLNEIIEAEQIHAQPGALALISRAAEGSMRDALSLLDQVIAFSGTQISVQSVRESIGLIEGQTLLEVLNGIFRKTPLRALQAVEQAYAQGYDLRLFTRNLIEFLHATLLIQIGASPLNTDSHANLYSSLELSEEEWKGLEQLSKLRAIEEIELFFQVLHQGLDWIARSSQPKIVLDVLIIKCATSEALVYLDALPQPQKTYSNPPEKSPPELPSHPTQTEGVSLSWEGFIEHTKKSRPLLASLLEYASAVKLPSHLKVKHSSTPTSPPLSPAEKTILLSFSPTEVYFREQLQSRVYQEQLIQLSKEYWGDRIAFQIELKDRGESLIARKDREEKERLHLIREKAKNDPILLEARSLFGGEIGPIDVLEASNHATDSP